MSKNKTKMFAELAALSDRLDEVSGDSLQTIINDRGGNPTGMTDEEALYRLAVEVAYYRKKKQLGYVQ